MRERSVSSLLFSAVVWIAAPGLHAATICAQDSSGLLLALASAGDGGTFDGQDNTILLTSGLYSTEPLGVFRYTSNSGKSITIEGGYDGDCASQDLTPGATQLDGAASTLVLSIQTTGDVAVRHLTIQNGVFAGGDGAGVQIDMGGTAARTLDFGDNVVRNNVSTFAVGGLLVQGAGVATIHDNLFYDNSAPASPALYVDFKAGSTFYLTNNTITANTATTVGTAVVSLGDPGAGPPAGYVTNNIIHGNTALYDAFLYSDHVFVFTQNDIGAINGIPAAASAGNVNVDPQFTGNRDFHLKATSPLVGAGTTTPPGTLAATDLDGRPRTFNGLVDMGAYERGDDIFRSGFD